MGFVSYEASYANGNKTKKALCVICQELTKVADCLLLTECCGEVRSDAG